MSCENKIKFNDDFSVSLNVSHHVLPMQENVCSFSHFWKFVKDLLQTSSKYFLRNCITFKQASCLGCFYKIMSLIA